MKSCGYRWRNDNHHGPVYKISNNHSAATADISLPGVAQNAQDVQYSQQNICYCKETNFSNLVVCPPFQPYLCEVLLANENASRHG